jgi:N-acetylneuraminic acid mutarotase
VEQTISTSTGPATVVTNTQLAGAFFPQGALPQDVTVIIEATPPASGQSCIPVSVDQFPGCYTFATDPGPTTFNTAVTAGICVETAGLTAAQIKVLILYKLDLVGETSVITPLENAPAAFLPCNALAAKRGFRGLLARAGDAILTLLVPAPLNAAHLGIGGLTGSFSKIGWGLPPTMSKVVGTDGQSALVSTPVALPPAVKLTNAHGQAVGGLPITFAVGSGGGSITALGGGAGTAVGVIVRTAGNGVAALASWKLGSSPGANTVVASEIGALGSPLTFTATGTVACNCWTTKTSMPTARAGPGVAAINGLLYVVGGDARGQDFATLEVYDPSTDTWTTKASMPTARFGLGGAAVNGILYAVGGDPTRRTVEAYDPASNTWTSKASMPTGLFLGGVAAVNGILYAVGGSDGSAIVATLEAYDPSTDTWTRKASMPTARANMGVAAINGLLYVVGGNFAANSSLATLEVYDPSTDRWTTKASMPTARTGLGVAAINGVLYAAGGLNQSGILNTVEAYDPSTDRWTTMASMPSGLYLGGAAAVKGILYTVGGLRFTPSFDWLATLQAYRP